MLRIPTAADTPPPLLAPLRRTAPEEAAESGGTSSKVKKRRKSKKGAESHSWETHAGKTRRGESARMRWLTISGAALLAITVAGLVIAMRERPDGAGSPDDTASGPSKGRPVERVSRVIGPRSEVDFLAEAEPLARKFLSATTVDQLLPLVRNPEVVGPKMREFYQEVKFKEAGMSQFNTQVTSVVFDGFRSVGVLTGNFDEKTMIFTDSAAEMKVDWESWVDWSEMTWKDFSATKPVEAKTFRVTLSPVEYYNFDFKDDTRWQSFRLVSPDRAYSLYGYVEKDSILDQNIRPNADESSVRLILELKFPPNAVSSDQVEIERIVSRGWLQQEENP